MLLDMGGILIPEISVYEGAVEDPALLERLRLAGIEEPEQLIVEGSRRLSSAYRALATECLQPDVDQVFADLAAPVRQLLLDAFRREAAQPAHPHARGVVAELSREYKLGLVSNTVIPGDHHARSLEAAGILQFMEAALWSANHGRRKPNPAMIIQVLEELQIAPDHAIFVGDKIRTDILAASRAGLRSVWLRKPDAPDTGEAEPHFIIGDLRELPELLREID